LHRLRCLPTDPAILRHRHNCQHEAPCRLPRRCCYRQDARCWLAGRGGEVVQKLRRDVADSGIQLVQVVRVVQVHLAFALKPRPSSFQGRRRQVPVLLPQLGDVLGLRVAPVESKEHAVDEVHGGPGAAAQQDHELLKQGHLVSELPLDGLGLELLVHLRAPQRC
jgi:hypothetical protein